MLYYICRLCLFLFSKSWTVSEVFIQPQRRYQLTWSAKPRDRQGGPHVPSCAHHSAVQLNPWPLGPSPSLCRLYLSFYCHPFLSSPGLAADTQKVQSVIKNKGRQRPEGAGEVKAVPSQGWPHQSCQLIVAPLWRCIVGRPQKERNLHRLVLHSWSGDIPFVLSRTHPALIPVWAGQRVTTQWRSLHPRWELQRLSASW